MDNENNWYDIPGFSKYEINEICTIRLKETKEFLNEYIRGGRSKDEGYRSVSMVTDYGSSVLLMIHLIGCAIFHGPKPSPELGIRAYTANHKDGNKLNCAKSNLEWTTNAENIIHAFKNKLNKSSQHVDLTNVITGEKITLYSLRELSRWIGNENVSGRTLISQYRDKLYKDEWKIEAIGVTSDSSGTIQRKRFYGLELDKPEEILSFTSKHEAAGILEMSRRTITRCLESKGKKIAKGWIFSEDKLDLIKLINK